MQKGKAELPALILLGITERTNNKNEMDPEKGIIGKTLARYFGEQLSGQIAHRSNPGITYCVYTNFESDEHGEYTYFIGEAVDSVEGQDLDTFTALSIPASQYQTFTTEPGKMPGVVISAWQDIWSMGESDFDGRRSYVADFEVYDERATDPNNSIVDIYIGIV